jgi:hypothetical protein
MSQEHVASPFPFVGYREAEKRNGVEPRQVFFEVDAKVL